MCECVTCDSCTVFSAQRKTVHAELAVSHRPESEFSVVLGACYRRIRSRIHRTVSPFVLFVEYIAHTHSRRMPAVLEAHERSRIVLFGYTLTYSTPHRMTWVSVYSVPILFVGMFKKLRIDTLEFSLRATTCKKGRANSHPRNTTTNQFIYTEKQKKNNNIRKQKFCRFLLYFKFLVSPVNYSVENVVQSTKITSRIFPPKISKIELSIHFKLSNACLE